MLYEIINPERLNSYSNYALLVLSGATLISLSVDYLAQKMREREVMRNIRNIEPDLERILRGQGIPQEEIDRILR